MPARVVALARKSRLAAASRRRRAEAPTRDEVRAAVFARDGHRCRLEALVGSWQHVGFDAVLIPPCFGPLTPHHRRKAGRGGAYTVENLVALCAHHNGLLEADALLARWARTHGLVVRAGDPEWRYLGGAAS